ncbi:MAG: SLC45 family MFS transporter [Deltaproteobacteria bacterium]|nr:SLC45 family MFS transporter [Deltaproteobacteria bacterium]
MDQKIAFSRNKTFLLGFGFLGVSMIWAMYNAYLPVFLKETFHLSFSVVGVIMTIDNIFAILLLPFLGALSDGTNTKIGKRRPYILIGAPLAMIFFILIPFANKMQILGLMMFTVIIMNLSMALFRSPVIALMPDITPSKYRSHANGIINFMGGVGALLVYFGGKPLYDRDISYPFVAAGILMFVACMLVVIFIRDDRYRPDVTGAAETVSLKKSFYELIDNLKDVIRGEKSLLGVLMAIFCWFIGFNSIETFFTSYAKFYLGMKESTGAMILGFYSLFFIIAAIPAGLIGTKFSRNKTIRIGLFGLIFLLIVASFFKTFLFLAILFSLAGCAWAFINVNSLPMVVDMTTEEKLGGYTGLYYFFSQAANIVAPPLAGLVIDMATAGGQRPKGYLFLLFFASFFFLLSLVIMFFVKRGEAHD